MKPIVALFLLSVTTLATAEDGQYAFVSRHDAVEAFEAVNPAQELRVRLDGLGMRIAPTSGEASWELDLELRAFGRGPQRWIAGRGRTSHEGDRTELVRPSVLEWVVNRRKGIEHGFVLEDRPAIAAERSGATIADDGMRSGSEVYLDLAVDVGLRWELTPDGVAADFYLPNGRHALRYAQLHVYDARGEELPSWMESYRDAAGRGLRLVFDDRQAAYPLTVDPIATTSVWIQYGNQESARLGYVATTAGDLNGDGYDDAIIATPFWDSPTVGSNAGFAHVYHGSPSGYAPTPDRIFEGDQFDARLGASAATAGDVNGDGYSDLLISWYVYDTPTLIDAGRVDLFFGSPNGVGVTPDWTWSPDQARSGGTNVAPAGDVNGDGYADFLIGASRYDISGTSSDEGMVFVFHGSATGPGATADLTLPGDTPGELFGLALNTIGDFNGDGYSDVAIAGPLWGNGTDRVRAGRVKTFLGSASGLSSSPQEVLVGEDGAEFGRSLSTVGDHDGDGYSDWVVGGYLYDIFREDAGLVSLRFGSASGYSGSRVRITNGGQEGAQLGRCVSFAGDFDGNGYPDILSGARYYEDPDQPYTQPGRAIVWLGNDDPDSFPGATWVVDGSEGRAYMGFCVGGAGDANGDGYADILIASEGANGATLDEGSVELFLGSPNFGGASTAVQTIAHLQASGSMPETLTVSTSGDVNGDGFEDLLIGNTAFDGDAFGEGAATLHFGGPSGIVLTPDWAAVGGAESFGLGSSVDSGGDVNGDGFADMLVVSESSAVVRLYIGGPAPDTTAAWEVPGRRAVFVGDVDADGYDDVLVGDPSSSLNEPDEGAVFLYTGSELGLSTQPDDAIYGDQGGARLGWGLAGAGDVDNDGFDDVIVSAPWYDIPPNDDLGAAYFYRGTATGLASAAAWTAVGVAGELLGIHVGGGGDTNGDGFADIVVSSEWVDPQTPGFGARGRVYVFEGSATGPETSPFFQLQGLLNTPDERLGADTAMTGDIDGDGFSDLLIGNDCPGVCDPNQLNRLGNGVRGSAAGLTFDQRWSSVLGVLERASSVATGGDLDGDGRAEIVLADRTHVEIYPSSLTAGPGRVRQLGAPGGPPISPGLRTATAGEFWFESTQPRSLVGRAPTRIAVEAKPQGQAFDGVATFESPWADPTPGSVDVDLVDGLDPVGHHWRLRYEYDRSASPYIGGTLWRRTPDRGAEQRDFDAAGICRAPSLPVTLTGANRIDETTAIELTWTDPNPGSEVSSYDVERASTPDFASPLVLVSEHPSTTWTEDPAETPPPGGVFFYRVIPVAACSR